MSALSMPVRLTAAEAAAAALAHSAAGLATAGDAKAFLAALAENHRLWLALVGIAAHHNWSGFDRQQADFVMMVSNRCGQRVHDTDVESLIGINRRLSARLIGNKDVDATTRRAQLAWQESGRALNLPLLGWLISQMTRKTGLPAVPRPAPLHPTKVGDRPAENAAT